MTISLEPVLEVEASIDGDPLAEQVFYIMEKSPAHILRATDLSSEIAHAKTTNALRNLSLRFIVTDSAGKGEIRELKAGHYYICGINYTRQRISVWNVEVELLPGRNKLVLNDDNKISS